MVWRIIRQYSFLFLMLIYARELKYARVFYWWRVLEFNCIKLCNNSEANEAIASVFDYSLQEIAFMEYSDFEDPNIYHNVYSVYIRIFEIRIK